MRLILIRHAEALAGRSGRWCGVGSCPGLTERGHAQAARLAQRLNESGELGHVDQFLCSPNLRARQTADALIGVVGERYEVADLLRSIDPGEADGQPCFGEELQYPAFDLHAEPDRVIAAGGESWNSFGSRVRTMIDRFAEEYQGDTVVAVAHGEIVMMSMVALLALGSRRERAWLEPLNTGLTEWQFADSAWTLVRYNDASHLASSER